MYDHTLYKQVQISRSDIRPHIKWAVSLVILHMITSIFLRALCGYIWVNILTLSPRGGVSFLCPYYCTIKSYRTHPGSTLCLPNVMCFIKSLPLILLIYIYIEGLIQFICILESQVVECSMGAFIHKDSRS